MDIDIIITWVDGNDPEWQEEKARYSPESRGDTRSRRYRSWDNLQYVLRGIETFAPWVHKVYLVTCGHYPAWLDLNCPRLVTVKHSDYIPKEWLPTFSSRAIDMNFHRIESLSEHFVYFNDDMFLTAPVTEEDFFKNGLPRETALMQPAAQVNVDPDKPYWFSPLLDLALINRHFKKKDAIRRNRRKWFAPCLGKGVFTNLMLMPWTKFTGLTASHLPYSYLKETYRTVWEKEGELLGRTCEHRFREGTDLNHWVFSYWQLAAGQFETRPWDFGKKYYINSKNIDAILSDIRSGSYKVLCLNDGADDADFEDLKVRLNGALDELLPERSSFELQEQP